jgi:hypothetical protein
VADLGTAANFTASGGMTLGGVHLFAVELAYDYCFLEIGAADIPDTASWREIGRFNGISNPDSVNCRGLPQSYWGTTAPSGIGNGTWPYLCADWTPFSAVLSAATMASVGQNGTEHLFVRWRAEADFLWDDQTGGAPPVGADTRGAWRIDHVFAKGNLSPNSYFPPDPTRTDNVNFESLSEPGRSSFITKLLPAAELPGGYWAGTVWVHGKPAIADTWHLTNTPTYSNQAKTCETSNRWMWAANLGLNGADGNIEYHNFYMRLASPVFDTSPSSPLTAGTPLAGQRITGNIITYDAYICIKQISQDATDRVVRFYDGTADSWRGWENDDFVNVGGCQNWAPSQFDDWSSKAFASMDSVQYGFEIFDQCDYNSNAVLGCIPGFVVPNPHRKNTFIFDNASVGFFAQTSTNWTANLFALFNDTYALDIPIHSASKENDELKVNDVWEPEDSLAVRVIDLQGIVQNSVVMHYRVSTDCGTSWTHETARAQGSKAKPGIEWFTKTLNFSEIDEPSEEGTPLQFNGVYQTILSLNTTDFPGTILNGGLLRPGTVIEYYLTARDNGGARDTIPDRNSQRRNFIHPMYGAERQQEWPFEVTVFPCITNWAGRDSVLLYNDWYARTGYDAESDKTLTGTGVAVLPFVSQLYEEALRDLNVRYERFDNLTSNISRGQGSGAIHTEPTDKDGYGGIRNPITGRNRYNAVIWPSAFANEYTVTDSSQLELGQYLASDANEANLWLSGVNLCEDEDMAGIVESFNGGDFWINYVGATLISGGCEDNSGITAKRYYIEGVNDALYTPFTSYGGWSDCPLRNQPDADFAVNVAGQGTELVILQFDNVARTLNETAGLRNTQPGTPNKMVTTMFGLDQVTTRSARACLTRAILADFGVTATGGRIEAADCDLVGGNPVDVPQGGAIRRFALHQNYPNPFNPNTRIRYSLPKDNMKVELTIFDVSGRQVRTLVNRLESGAEHEIYWDGRNERGEDVSSGVYFYSLKADEQSTTKKMVLLK